MTVGESSLQKDRNAHNRISHRLIVCARAKNVIMTLQEIVLRSDALVVSKMIIRWS
jgi:hypothetical protein